MIREKLLRGFLWILFGGQFNLRKIDGRESDKLYLFSQVMQHELDQKAYKGPWDHNTIEQKLGWLDDEEKELIDEALKQPVEAKSPAQIVQEASHVAICAMIIADHYGGLEVVEE